MFWTIVIILDIVLLFYITVAPALCIAIHKKRIKKINEKFVGYLDFIEKHLNNN